MTSDLSYDKNVVMLCHTGSDARHRLAARFQVLVHRRLSQDFSAFARSIVRRVLEHSFRQTLVAVAVDGESQKTGIMNSDDGYQAAISPDWLSGPDPKRPHVAADSKP